MESALQQAGIRNVLGPDGSLNGPEETLEPVTVGGRQWLQGSLCEQGNCGDHYLRFYIRRVRIRFWVSTLTVRHAGSGKPPAEEAETAARQCRRHRGENTVTVCPARSTCSACGRGTGRHYLDL